MSVAAPACVARVPHLVSPALRAAVDRIAPPVAQVAAYHLGWVDAGGHPVEAGGGKSLRAALALVSAEAAGGHARQGIPAAVAVQLVHEFSLLHDDLMDGDTTRRHRPTAWTVFGAGPAILAGDALLTAAVEVLVDAGDGGPGAVAALLRATQGLIAGQAADLGQERRRDVSVDECLTMASDKTGALFAASATIGAHLAGGGDRLIAALHNYGAELGLAFQLVDDLLGIWGDPDVTGKPVHADLRAHKRSVPVVVALSAGTPQAAELDELLASSPMTDEADVERAVALIEATGADDWTRQAAVAHAERACAALEGATLPEAVASELVDVARYVVGRDL